MEASPIICLDLAYMGQMNAYMSIPRVELV